MLGADTDTVAAIATAAGRAGIGVIRISGPRASALLLALVGRALPPRQACLVRFRDAAGESIDQGIALHFPAPGSYTGEDVVELQGHGGPAVLHAVLERCLDLGARIAEPGEFTRRAFLHGKLDLAQAEAVADLIEANSKQAARAAMRSLQGAFSSLVRELQDRLTDLRVLVEATLDFPEEEVEHLQRDKALQRLQSLRLTLARTLEATTQGSLLREGATVALVGPPNSGKSTIINMLSGDDVAIVSPIPGTTRDLVRQSIVLRGVPLHIVDTAGIRDSDDPIETMGIDRARAAARRADVAVVVLDASLEQSPEMPGALDEYVAPDVPAVYVHNKIDLVAGAPRIMTMEGRQHVWVSAKSGIGMDLLIQAILQSCGWVDLDEPQFIARERHVRALKDCAARLGAAEINLSALELAAEELRLAQSALSQLTGEVAADDLLGEIFSRFCIGK